MTRGKKVLVAGFRLRPFAHGGPPQSASEVPDARETHVSLASDCCLYLGRHGVELALMLSFRRAQELVGTGSWCRCLALPPTTNRGARASGARRNEFPSPFSLCASHAGISPHWLLGLGSI